MPIKRTDPTDINNEQGLINLGSIPGLAPVAAFNPRQIENLLRTKGIRAIHYKHAPNPDRETIAGGVTPNTNAAKMGWRYYSAREILVVPQQFKLEDRLNVQGIWGQGSVLLNVAGHYEDGCKEHAFFRPYDLLLLGNDPCGPNNITIAVDQLIEFNPTGSMKLNFRCEGVDVLFGKDYTFVEDQDFIIDNGLITWLPAGRKPRFHDGKGEILSIVYYTRPVFIIQNIPHAVRITPGNDHGTANEPRRAYYAPQQLVAKQAWTRIDNEELFDYGTLPDYNHYRDSQNVTGGS
jgi:hypothetical protein